MKSFEQYLKAVQTEGYNDEVQKIENNQAETYASMGNKDLKLSTAVKSYEKTTIKVTVVNPKINVPSGMVYAEDVNDVVGGEVVNGGTFPQQGINSKSAVKDLELSYFTFYNNENQIKEIVYSEEVKGKRFQYFIPKGESTMYILPGYVPKKYSYRAN